MPQDLPPSGLLPQDTSARLIHVAGERYDYQIERECENCLGWVRVRAHYNNSWQTPMSGAPFELWVDGEPFAFGRLKSIRDLNKEPGDPLTAEEYAQLGTFTKRDVPPGMVEFILLEEALEAQVQALEDQCIDKTARLVRKWRGQYADDWAVWDAAGALERADLIARNATFGFRTGVGRWIDEEQAFLDGIGDILARAWDAIVNTLGELGTALHPDNIGATAQAVWDGARDTAQRTAAMIAGLPEAAREFYAGTILVIENMAAIVSFLEAFVTADIRGVEDFVTTTLPLLVENDAKAAAWASFIRNNADAWQLVIEVVGYTKGPALLLAAVAGIVGSIPPQNWANFGVASVAVVAIEIAVSAVIGFLVTAATVFSGGSAGPAAMAVIVGRAAKWGHMGSRAAGAITTLLGGLDEIMEMVIELGDLSKKARRRMTRQHGSERGGTNQETRQDRDPGEDSESCRVCNKALGEKGHPNRTPDRDGITGRSGSARRTGYAPSGRYSDARIGEAMKAAQPPTHPVHQGVTMTHHHLLTIEKVSGLSWSNKLERLGYVIHDPGNLVLMPNHPFGACHLEVQSHRSRHTMGVVPGASKSYHREMDRLLEAIRRKIRQAVFCKEPVAKIQREINQRSTLILGEIASFNIMIQNDNDAFKPGNTGCGLCAGVRDHGPMQTTALRTNHPQQSQARASLISYPKSGQWPLATGK